MQYFRRRAGSWLAAMGVMGIIGGAAEAQTYTPQVVYGDDNRREVTRLGPARAKLAQATVALIAGDARLSGKPTQIRGAPTLAEANGLCDGQRFANQPVAAFCSGVLVAPDVVVTAGHCIRGRADLAQTLFVFDFRLTKSGAARRTFPGAAIYAGKSIVRRVATETRDHALIRLDRPVSGREPVALAVAGGAGAGTPVFVIGHPSGLPTKMSAGAVVVSASRTQLVTNLDTFAGDSGAPVFDARTNRLVGIITDGLPDYVALGGCNVVNQLPNLPGSEIATRSAVFAPVLTGLGQ
jgi:Trypsin-like peptidase domain